MEQKPRVLVTYALYIFIIILMLLLPHYEQMIAGIAMVILMAQHLQLLYVERWERMHYLSVSLLVLIGYFTLLYLLTVQTFVSEVLGGILVVACAVLFLAEMIDGWRTYNLLDRMLRERQKPSKES